jgi:hypothetical protein
VHTRGLLRSYTTPRCRHSGCRLWAVSVPVFDGGSVKQPGCVSGRDAVCHCPEIARLSQVLPRPGRVPLNDWGHVSPVNYCHYRACTARGFDVVGCEQCFVCVCCCVFSRQLVADFVCAVVCSVDSWLPTLCLLLCVQSIVGCRVDEVGRPRIQKVAEPVTLWPRDIP